jgi:Ca2+-binding EF-hand superfamily protein
MAKGKGKGKKGKKTTSNVYSMFESSQIAEFKEAFGMMDANRDGIIDKNDLKSTYASLGINIVIIHMYL